MSIYHLKSIIFYTHHTLGTVDHCEVLSTKWFRFCGDIIDPLLIRLISWLVSLVHLLKVC